MDSKICRLCLIEPGTICLFNNHDDNVLYCNKVMHCVHINIAEGDGFPDSMCVDCLTKLSVAYDFINKAQESDRTLRSLSFDCKPKIEDQDLKTESEEIKEEENREDNYYEVEFESHSDVAEEPKKSKSRGKGPKTCSICGHRARCHKSYELHMRAHFKVKLSKCDICFKRLSDKYALRNHKEKLHGVQVVRKFKKKVVEKEKSTKGPLQCVVCGQILQSQSALENHNTIHTGERPFQCDTCNKTFRIKSYLQRHIETNHLKRSRTVTCETCGSSFYKKSDIVVHMRSHTKEKPFECELCLAKFSQISSLIRHRKHTHAGERTCPCPICNKLFFDKQSVKRHMLCHSDKKQHKCHLCDKLFKTKSARNVHISLHSNETQFICSFCGMIFNVKGNLKAHIKRKHSGNAGECKFCKKEFPNLAEHELKHTGETPFVCQLCNKGFFKKRSLSYHISFKHEKANKFRCTIDQCTKGFPMMHLLDDHLYRHHSDTLPLVCSYCPRRFSRKSDVTRHMKGSHLNKVKEKPNPVLTAVNV